MKNYSFENWETSGEYITYGIRQHRLFVKQFGNPKAEASNTLLLIHGFPESSFSYHLIVDGMLEIFERIILFDMLGYGLSDKPDGSHYTYSLLEQVDTAFHIWNYFDVSGGHILAHDMGDSVATEILARHENNLMPEWFSSGIQSMTFTNGSMVLDFAELRITQKILLSRFGSFFSSLVNYKLFRHQIISANGNQNLSEASIQALWEGNLKQDGHRKSYLTIKYLNDRKQFEKNRWLPALGNTKLPIHLCWADQDAVARVEMAYYLKEHVCKNAHLSIMEGLGHFCQLENPDAWLHHISNFYKRIMNQKV